jgi:hypothetical protein
MWVFGPFQGISMDVVNIDPIALEDKYRNQKEKRDSTRSSEKRDSTRSSETVLSLLVQGQNTELLNDKYIQALLDTKWDKYARDELMNRLFQTILLIACLMEAQVVPITEDERLLIAFHIPKSFDSPMEITQCIVFFYFLGKILRFFFSSQASNREGTVVEYIMLFSFGLCGPLIAGNRGLGPILANMPGPIVTGVVAGVARIVLFVWQVRIMTHLLSRAARVIDPTFIDLNHVFRLEDRPTRDDGELPGEARRSETPSTLERWVYWVCFLAIVTIVVDCGIALRFLGMSFQEMVALDMAVATEFSLWQSFVFLFVVPWALILSRSRDERRQVAGCCLFWIFCCFLLMVFFFVFQTSTKWQQDAARIHATSKGTFDRVQQVVFDDVLYEECHENNKKRYNACVGYNM